MKIILAIRRHCLDTIPAMETETPRTDAFQKRARTASYLDYWEFARDLERDLHALMEEYEARRAQWGDEYLWQKHEDKELLDGIFRRIHSENA